MAMLLASGFGSLLTHEIGKLALEYSPIVKQIATSTVVDIAKKSFDMTLDQHPHFANFLGAFGIHRFNPKKTLSSRGNHKRISYHNY